MLFAVTSARAILLEIKRLGIWPLDNQPKPASCRRNMRSDEPNSLLNFGEIVEAAGGRAGIRAMLAGHCSSRLLAASALTKCSCLDLLIFDRGQAVIIFRRLTAWGVAVNQRSRRSGSSYII